MPGLRSAAASSAAAPSLRRRLSSRASRRAAALERSLLGGTLGLAPALDVGLGLLELGGGVLVGGVQALLALLVDGHGGLEVGELALGVGGAGPALLQALAQPADLGLARLDPAAAGADLTGQLGQALAPVGRGPHQPGQPLLLGGVRALGLGPVGDRGGQGVRGLGDLGQQRLLLLAHLRRLRPAASRGRGRRTPPSGSSSDSRRTRSAARDPVEVSRSRSEDRREPALLGPGQLGRGLLRPPASSTARRARTPVSASSTSVRRATRAVSSATSCSSVLVQLDQVVGEQPQPGVAGVGLDDRGPAGDLGLTARAARAGDGSRR